MRSAPEPFLLAQHLARNGQLAEARAAFAHTLREHPDFLPGYLALSRLAAHQGDTGTALETLRAAMTRAASNAAARRAIRQPLAELLATISPAVLDARLEADLLDCLDDDQLDPQPLARITAETLLLKDGNAPTDPLWTAFLSRCINTHPGMEARLVAMRDALIGSGDATSPLLPALAFQAFASQYVWPEPEIAPQGLSEALVRPLAEYLEGGLWQRLAARVNDLVIEREHASTLPSFAAPEGLSAEVQRQYEAHPYPRWQAPPASRRTDLRQRVESLPGINRATLPSAPLAVLIAGCGTGYEAIDLARMDPSLSVTALDLSRASLAFAQRKTDELGIANIRFLHGDILALDALGQTFDIANSTGVLHHMASPEAGLASIVRALRPGGAIRLALYSHRARAPVRAAHALIAERGWQSDAAGIRAFREHILSLPAGDPLATLRESDDFYSMSGCRDLAFHVHERHYGFPGIAALVAGAGLKLVGFDATPEAMSRFHQVHGAQADPLDLSLWDAVEAEHPFLFAGMIHFWCQKRQA